MLREVRLYGVLGEAFGRVHRFEITTPAEAIRALRANFGRRFDKLLYRMRNEPFRVQIGREIADKERLLWPVGREPILIIPVVCGAAKSPYFGILIGVALIALSGPIGAAVGGAAGTGTLFGLTATQVAGAAVAMGISLALGGVVQLLSRPPDSTDVEKPGNRPSYAFDGPRNTVAQGNPVPVLYGHLIIGSQAVSMGLFTDSIVTAPVPPHTWTVPPAHNLPNPSQPGHR